jgi:hypothetical protein
MLSIPATSREYVQVPVRALSAGLPVDLSADTVEMAFLTSSAAPTSGDWRAASWDVDSTGSPARYRAQCLVGPGGTAELAAGVYNVWVRVTDNPEVPVRRAGQLRIT